MYYFPIFGIIEERKTRKMRIKMIGLNTAKTRTNEVILKLNSALKQLQGEDATEIAEVLVKDYINFRKESASWSSKMNVFPRNSVDYKSFENQRAYKKKFKIFRHIMIDLDSEKFFFQSTFEIKEILDKENVVLLSHFSKEDKIKLELLLTQLLGTHYQAAWFKYNLKKKKVLKEVSEFVTEVVSETVKDFVLQFSENADNYKFCIEHHLLGENNQIGRKELLEYLCELSDESHPSFHLEMIFGDIDKLVEKLPKVDITTSRQFDVILENCFFNSQLGKIQNENPIDFDNLSDVKKEKVCRTTFTLLCHIDTGLRYYALYLLNFIVGNNKKNQTIIRDVFSYIMNNLKTKFYPTDFYYAGLNDILSATPFKYFNQICKESKFVFEDGFVGMFAGQMDLNVSEVCEKIIPSNQPNHYHFVTSNISENAYFENIISNPNTDTFYHLLTILQILKAGRPELEHLKLQFDKKYNCPIEDIASFTRKLYLCFLERNILDILTFSFDETIYSEEEIESIKEKTKEDIPYTQNKQLIFRTFRK